MGGNPPIIDHLVEGPPSTAEPLGGLGDGKQPVILRNFLSESLKRGGGTV